LDELECGMQRAQKAQSIETLSGVFANAGAVVVTHYLGLTVHATEDLRTRLRKEGATFKVVKNRLAQKALAGAADDARALFKGPVAIAYGADPVSAAKATTAFAKENEKLIIVGALMGGEVLDAARVQALAKLPSLDELRGKLVGLILAPATKVAAIVQAPAGQLARVVGAYAAKAA
jgi:large subunit ribosomal protein L10